MRLLKLISVIFGIVLVLAGIASVAAGGFVLHLYRSQSDADGFFMTPSETIGSNGFALTVPDINGQLVSGWERWGLSHSDATLRVTGSSKLPAPVFVGVAPTDRLTEYVSGVARDRVTSIDLRSGSIRYDHVDGTARLTPPEEQSFWVASATGTGAQTLEWELQEGDWAIVIMNGDASAPVAADVRLGARFGIMYPLIAGLMAGGVALMAIGVALIVFGARRRRVVAPTPPRTQGPPRTSTPPRGM